MDFNFTHPNPIFRSMADTLKAAKTVADKQRWDFPEIFFMTVSAVQSGGKFQLEAPWGGILDRVPCVDFRLTPYLKEGMTVAVRYSRVDRNECYIRNIGPARVGRPSTDTNPLPDPIGITDWIHSLSTPGLIRVAGKPSNFPDFGSDPNQLWSFSGDRPLLVASYTHTSLGPCFVVVRRDGALLVATVIDPVGNELLTETIATGATGTVAGVFYRNNLGAIFPETDRLQIIADLREDFAINLHHKILNGPASASFVSARKWFCANFLDQATLRGDYRRVYQAAQSSPFPVVPDTITFSLAGDVRDIEVYQVGILTTTINPESVGTARAQILPVEQSPGSAWAIADVLEESPVFVGLGQGLSINDNQDVAAAYSFAPASVINPFGAPTCPPGNYTQQFRKTQAWALIVGLDGGSTPILLEEVTHDSPPADATITGAWETWVQANPVGGFPAPFGGITYTWAGRAGPRTIQTSLFNNTIPIYTGSFNPDYLERKRPICFPLTSRVAPFTINPAGNRQLFAWEDAPVSGTQANSVSYGDTHLIAWLHPHSYLGAGGVGESNNIVVRNAPGDTTVMGINYFDWLNYYVPQNWRHWKRKIVAIRNGAVVATADLTQYLNLKVSDPNNPSSELVSSNMYGVPDNIWAPLPAGRVVFVVADKRFENDLRKESVPWLYTLQKSNLAILSQVELFDQETLADDIREASTFDPVYITDFFVGDGIETTFTLTGSLFEDWVYVQTDNLGLFNHPTLGPFVFSGMQIIFDNPPDMGDNIIVEFISEYNEILGDVIFPADTLRWDHYAGRPMQCRGAIRADEKEWLVVGMELRDRLNNLAVRHMLVLVDMDNNMNLPPSVSHFTWDPGDGDIKFPVGDEWDSVVIAGDRIYWVRQGTSQSLMYSG